MRWYTVKNVFGGRDDGSYIQCGVAHLYLDDKGRRVAVVTISCVDDAFVCGRLTSEGYRGRVLLIREDGYEWHAQDEAAYRYLQRCVNTLNGIEPSNEAIRRLETEEEEEV